MELFEILAVTLPGTLDNLAGSRHFYDTGLVEFDAAFLRVRVIPEGVFMCSQLRRFCFPLSLDTIGPQAFCSTKLQRVDLRGLTKLAAIGQSAFESCAELRSVQLGGNLRVREYAFGDLPLLVMFEVGDTVDLGRAFFSKKPKRPGSLRTFVLRGTRCCREGLAGRWTAVVWERMTRGEGIAWSLRGTTPLWACLG